MAHPLRVLILEDNASDAELMIHDLRRAGFDPSWRRVETEAAFVAALDGDPEVILADHSLPGFDVFRALRHLRERMLDIPCLVITGTVGDEAAAECIKQGACDYLLKDRLARLGGAVLGALEQRRLGREKRLAENRLRERSEQLRAMAAELTLAEQRERRRLAEVLHDGIQQLLVGAKLRVQPLDRVADAQVREAGREVAGLLRLGRGRGFRPRTPPGGGRQGRQLRPVQHPAAPGASGRIPVQRQRLRAGQPVCALGPARRCSGRAPVRPHCFRSAAKNHDPAGGGTSRFDG